MSLKLLALKAHEKAQAIAEEKAAKKLARQTNETRKQFIRDFKLEPDEVDGNKIVCDGYEFGKYGDRWFLWGNCYKCGERGISESFDSLEELGRLIIEFRVDPNRHSWYICDRRSKQ